MTGERDQGDPAGPAEQPRPLLRVVRGEPTDEEVAALVTVLSALSVSGEPEPAAAAPHQWSAPHRLVRQPLHAAPGGWRAHSQPR